MVAFDNSLPRMGGLTKAVEALAAQCCHMGGARYQIQKKPKSSQLGYRLGKKWIYGIQQPTAARAIMLHSSHES